MALRAEKEKQLEEVYQRNLQYHECFTKEKGPGNAITYKRAREQSIQR